MEPALVIVPVVPSGIHFGLLRGKLDPEGLHDSQGCAQGGIAFGAERAIELLARQLGPVGNLRHAFGTRNDAKGMGDIGRIIRRQRGRHEVGNGLVRFQVVSRIKGSEFLGHGHSSH